MFRPLGDSRAPRQAGRRGLAVVLAALILAGLGGGAWYGWHTGWLRAALPLITNPAANPPSVSASATQSAASATIVAQGNLIATNAALADATARLTALQQRLAELGQQAAAASGQATRAESLLVALAARRAIDRGQPLGYLETALRIRFGESQPTAVDQIVAAAQKPLTIGGLTEEFTQITPKLVNGPANEGGWDWLSRQFASMFVIRHDDMPSPAPESRINRARIALAGQRVDLALAEIARMPGKDAATDWVAHAREWQATQHALDQLESAALAPAPASPAALAPASVAPVAAPPASGPPVRAH